MKKFWVLLDRLAKKVWNIQDCEIGRNTTQSRLGKTAYSSQNSFSPKRSSRNARRKIKG